MVLNCPTLPCFQPPGLASDVQKVLAPGHLTQQLLRTCKLSCRIHARVLGLDLELCWLGQQSRSLRLLGRDSGHIRFARSGLPAPTRYALRRAWQAAFRACSVQLAEELYVPSARPRGQRFALVSKMPVLSPQPLLLVGSPAVSSSTPAPIWSCECPLDRVHLGMAKAGKATTIGNCNMSAPPRRAELPCICRVPAALNRSPEVL